MKDQLLKAMALEGRVRFYLVSSAGIVQEAKDRFEMSSLTADILGRVLSVGSIMGSMLKSDKEMLTINILGGGPVGSIVVDAYANGNVRGFVSNPGLDSDRELHLSVSQAVGTDGTLTVTKDLSMEENWSGTVQLQNGEIAQDFAYYFTLSEQTPTAVSVGINIDSQGKVTAAGALVLQMMPDATDTDISICEHVLGGLKPMSVIMQDYDDASLELLAEHLFEDTKILEVHDVRFFCPCSKEKTGEVLSTLSAKELKAMMEEDHGAQVTCNFCNGIYHFSEEDLREIYERNHKNLEISEELEKNVSENQGD